jgi:hypothetical protein
LSFVFDVVLGSCFTKDIAIVLNIIYFYVTILCPPLFSSFHHFHVPYRKVVSLYFDKGRGKEKKRRKKEERKKKSFAIASSINQANNAAVDKTDRHNSSKKNKIKKKYI